MPSNCVVVTDTDRETVQAVLTYTPALGLRFANSVIGDRRWAFCRRRHDHMRSLDPRLSCKLEHRWHDRADLLARSPALCFINAISRTVATAMFTFTWLPTRHRHPRTSWPWVIGEEVK